MINNILVIEDNEGDQLYNEIILTRALPSVNIFQAYDGKEALDMLSSTENQIELILLDINMPRMNGLGFLHEFCGDNKREIPVVVMLTSSGQDKDKENTIKYCCVKDYFLKPLNPEAVKQLETLYLESVAKKRTLRKGRDVLRGSVISIYLHREGQKCIVKTCSRLL